ncbi:MAG: hypothetical protein MJ175_10255, partial [Clostridia bacterium]|nr:hypothetical protein [Clostridia bacterium]
VASYSLDADGNTFVLRFADALPGEILSAAAAPNALAVDNLTHTAAFDCTKNRFGSCRARGILVSTPKPVRITDNYFASSGCAVLVAGDSNYWYEPGEWHEVEIARNGCTDVCRTSMYQFCDGIISVCPVVPEPDAKTPFHKNIRIHDNIFDTADTPVLYAFSTLGLTFTGNRIYRSPAADKWQNGASHLINLAACNSVCISDNSFIGDFTLEKVRAENCLNVILDD